MTDEVTIAVLLLQSPSFTDPSPHVSDNSLDSRLQGLIDRGSSLISPSSTVVSSPPASNYFNSKRKEIVPTECLHPPLMNTAATNDGVPSARPTRTTSKGNSELITVLLLKIRPF